MALGSNARPIIGLSEPRRQADAAQSSTDALVARLLALRDLIETHAVATERADSIAMPVITALEEAGLFALMAPATLGGLEAEPSAVLEVLKLLAYLDGSTGWYAQAATTGPAIMGAFLGDHAIDTIFRSGGLATCAGQAAPTGKAERVGNGYRISGSFSFASGISNARWVLGGYILHEAGRPVRDEAGQPTLLIAFAPRERVEICGNWRVLGLRGTGSFDYRVPEQIVHEDFVFDPASAQARRGGPLYRMGFLAIPSLCHASFAAGCARRLLDEWVSHARSKRRGGGGYLAETDIFRRALADAHAKLAAAEAYVRRSFAALYADAVASGDPRPDLLRDARLSASHIVSTSVAIAQTAFTSAATSALRDGSILQRCFRDLQGANAHFLTNEQSFVDLGAELADAPPFLT